MLNVHGHELAVRTFEAALKSGRLHHAYLFSGPAHVGKTTLATQLAQAVNCTGSDPPCGACGPCVRIGAGMHADVVTIEIDPDATEGARTVISIDAVKDLIASAHLRPYEGRTRVYIVQSADRLSQDAANALLKVLEEPPPDVLLLLLTDNPDGVLPTIRSRCQLIELRPLPVARVAELLRDEHGAGEEQAEMLA
ncbi:MAG: DNA polymerase III subunit delta', partial [Chloroflexi bacterium]|nr:DNA polymerase III subunit delta' [Chloroflexota bacterium]